MARFIGLEAVGWDSMTSSTWGLILAGISCTGIVLGLAYVLYSVVKRIASYFASRTNTSSTAISPDLARYFDLLESSCSDRPEPRSKLPPLKSFGVYLGAFEAEPTAAQSRLLSQWDGLIVDLTAHNVVSALEQHVASTATTKSRFLARVDIESIVLNASTKSTQSRSTEFAIDTVARHVRAVDSSTMTGVVLCNWQTHFTTPILNRLVHHLDSVLGFHVYLEVGPPTYLSPDDCLNVDMGSIKGIVFRNAIIWAHDGDRKNYFQMEESRRTMRALAKVSYKGETTVMMWETLDDGIEMSYAVAKRSANWCRYNCAISWIGSNQALVDADVAEEQTLMSGEPLGAMMWLKTNETMAAHDVWRTNEVCNESQSGTLKVLESLESYIPNITERLKPELNSRDALALDTAVASAHTEPNPIPFIWPADVAEPQSNPLTCSPSNLDYTRLGCFPLGLDVRAEAFDDLVEGQRKLRRLGLLNRIDSAKLNDMSGTLMDDVTARDDTAVSIRELKQLLLQAQGGDDDRLKIYVGLHSGFRDGLVSQFWGLWDVDSNTGDIEIYLNAKTASTAADQLGVIMHTFLSSRNVPRDRRLVAESRQAASAQDLSVRWELPRRFVADIQQCTPSETLLFLRRLVRTNQLAPSMVTLRDAIVRCCRYQLIDVPTLQQYRALSSSTYLGGNISAEDLVRSRIIWHAENGLKTPTPTNAVSLFNDVDAHLSSLLIRQQGHFLSSLEAILATILKRDHIDVAADLFALAIFCAFRRLALDEVYLEVLDRNPLPNPHPDQAACFSEMFALGSQCEAYLDMTSNVLGTILSKRYHEYYLQNQPPPRNDNTTELPTAYSSTQVDLDGRPERPTVSAYYQVTFLGIFAAPALVDILLLTTIGRGLYLTTFMTSDEKSMATAALMTSLLLCGAISTWIGSGGTYYLHAMAFPALNMFVLTRFIAGIAVSLLVGVLALIAIGLVKGFYAGIIFLLYLVCLSTYLNLLGALSIYQYPGFAFQSGRTIVIGCIPILFLSPILTLWIGHDIIVYLCVLYGFLGVLLFGLRRIVSQWGAWYLEIPLVSDAEVVDWYNKLDESGEVIAGLPAGTDLAATPFPRLALTSRITQEYRRKPWQKKTTDELVKRLAQGYQATLFLMDWYARYTRTAMPYKFSPTWNLQCKASLDALKEMQKGLKLHNAFVHWRQGSDEVWCGFLYFVIALMDKWVFLISGGQLVGLSDADSTVFRLSVGFGLAYYLMAAVCLDSVAQPLWVLAQERTNQPISSLAYLRDAAVNDAQARRKLYWNNFAKFFLMHAWGLSVAAVIMWAFEGSKDAVIMFMAYIGAYSGLLFYQYNRIFAGTRALKDLATAALIGLVGGPILVRMLPDFQYGGVATLALATWSTAILSLWTANVGWTRYKDADAHEPTKVAATKYGTISAADEGDFTATELAEIFTTIVNRARGQTLRLQPTAYPGSETVHKLATAAEILSNGGYFTEAFPDIVHLLDQTIALWQGDKVVVDLIPQDMLSTLELTRMRAIVKDDGLVLHVLVVIHGAEETSASTNDMLAHSAAIAEAVLQATATFRLNVSRSDAEVLSTCLTSTVQQSSVVIAEGCKEQLESSSIECDRVIAKEQVELMRHVLLGIDADHEWDQSPSPVRQALLSRWLNDAPLFNAQAATWLCERSQSKDFSGLVARCDLGAASAIFKATYARALRNFGPNLEKKFQQAALRSPHRPWTEHPGAATMGSRLFGALSSRFKRGFASIRFTIKLLVIATVADAEFPRELDYVVSSKTFLVRWPAKVLLGGLWNYCRKLQQLILPIFLLHKRENLQTLYSCMRGVKTVVKRDRIVIDSLNGALTGFQGSVADNPSSVAIYKGRLKKSPGEESSPVAINTYDEVNMHLLSRQEFSGKQLAAEYSYQYDETVTSPVPVTRRCIQGDSKGQELHYDGLGHVVSGSYLKDNETVLFTLAYRKNAKYADELLRGHFIWPHIAITVDWSVAHPKRPGELDMCVPHSKVNSATFAQGDDVWHNIWDYDHRSHPIITSRLNGLDAETPDMIKHDWYGVLKKPEYRKFELDNPLSSFTSLRSTITSRLLGKHARWSPSSTSDARTHLWKTWKTSKDLDAVTTRWLDETALRHDDILKPYWRARDTGRLSAAAKYLDARADAILARVDVDPDVSAWSNITYKISDLYSFGQGGDTRINTRTVSTQMRDSDETLHILAMDTGTWPNEGGGVSACRRDMVNDLKTIRWHVLAESANDFGVPKFQVEKNVQSLTVLPLWGLDFLTPTHGVFTDSLDSAIQIRSHNTKDADIRANFLPILRTLVRCSRAITFTSTHVRDSTQALLDLNSYFETDRHWSEVWMSDVVKAEWRKLWLTESMANAIPISEWLDAEHPTLLHLDNALDMWSRYLFIFSIPVSVKIPDVFQASHHFAGASYGVLCKIKRNVTLHVWDHCISWREVTVFLSSAMSFDSPFVCTSLISLSRVASVLILHHADVVLPCADFFNPGWEVELGTQEGTMGHRRTYARKIDPVVNGICNMDSFKPIEKIRSKKPTVTMLSHVRFVKDIKNAILAADIIVNEWGFTDYQLDIYGDTEKAPAYSVECKEILASKSLRDYVTLKGLGSPSKVLEEAWIFLNSSISEGLPLAMGEAALTGVPVVCTDVGASFRVVTDPITWKKFSAVVAPNDAYSLARAQINVLGLLDEWSEYAGDEPGYRPKLSLRPTSEEVAMITKRMYEKTEQRRALGMLGRKNVLSSFSGDRYLREHEQMLWVGKQHSPAYRARGASPQGSTYQNTNCSTPHGEKEHMSWEGSVKQCDYADGSKTEHDASDRSDKETDSIEIVVAKY